MQMKNAFLALGAAALTAALIVGSGCEDEPGTTDLDRFFAEHPFISDPRVMLVSDVVIEPTAAAVTEVGEQVVFRGRGGDGPYKWYVANDNGHLRVEGWSQAVYITDKVAPNNVIVQDTHGHAGIASINANASNDVLAVTANPTSLAADGDKSIATANGGSPEYHWSVVDAALGHIVGPDTGSSVVYMRDHSGDNVITVTDDSGQIANVLIKQP